MEFKIRSQTRDSAYVYALHRHVNQKTIIFNSFFTWFNFRLLRFVVMKYQSFVYNKLKFVYYMTAEDRDYLKYLKIVRDFTDQVC